MPIFVKILGGFKIKFLTPKLQLISYKRYLECTLIQWRLSIYPWCTQVAAGTFFMKSPVGKSILLFGQLAVYFVEMGMGGGVHGCYVL